MQNDTVLTFGLGGACVADEIEVQWPDNANGIRQRGSVEKFLSVAGNRRIEIRQGVKSVQTVAAP